MNNPPYSYQLLIKIKTNISVQIGQLGRFDFPAGYYVYTGSARRNMEARLRRHRSKNKKLRWHIDYLLNHPAAEIIDTRTAVTDECRWNQSVKGIIIAKGFGASDCRQNCGSHLKKITEEPLFSF